MGLFLTLLIAAVLVMGLQPEHSNGGRWAPMVFLITLILLAVFFVQDMTTPLTLSF